MTVEAITFDVGGTLIVTERDVPEAFVGVATEYGYELDLAYWEGVMPEIFRAWEAEAGQGGYFWSSHEGCEHFWTGLYRRLCTLAGVSPEHVEPIVDAVYRGYLRGPWWRVFEDARPALETLRAAGTRLAVVSNWDLDLFTILDDLGLSKYFDCVVPSAAVGVSKPDRGIFMAALDSLGVEPQNALHVGDTDLADGEGARKAGLQAVIIDRSGKEHPGFVAIADLRRLVDFLA